MKLLLLRKHRTPLSTTGDLFIDEKFECYTLERPLESIKDSQAPYAIPSGTYKVTLEWSSKHQRNVPWLHDVPHRESIEIHVGNYPKDSLGCILVGQSMGFDQIGMSKMAFEGLMRKLQGEKGLSITIRED